MPARLSGLAAWQDLAPSARIGTAPVGTMTISQLASWPGYDVITSTASGPDLTRRARQLRAVHLAIQVVTQVLCRPMFTDGVWIQASGCQLGLTIDARAEPVELWLEDGAPTRTCLDAAAAGAMIGDLLNPVIRAAATYSRIHESAIVTVAPESAVAALYRTARSARCPDHASWLDTASSAIAQSLGAQITAERLLCRPDCGPAVAVPARKLCCVLSPRASASSCAGCPKTGTVRDQARHATERLATMDDEDFFRNAGRLRIPARSRVT